LEVVKNKKSFKISIELKFEINHTHYSMAIKLSGNSFKKMYEQL